LRPICIPKTFIPDGNGSGRWDIHEPQRSRILKVQEDSSSEEVSLVDVSDVGIFVVDIDSGVKGVSWGLGNKDP